MAIGGGLYGHYLGSLSPRTLYLSVGFLGILMAVVGGINSLAGAVTGTVVVSAIVEGLRRAAGELTIGSIELKGLAGLQEIVLAVFLLFVLIRMPSGLTGGQEASVRRLLALPRKVGRAKPVVLESANSGDGEHEI
jgi:branched-chain amino acid transport system permease protein